MATLRELILNAAPAPKERAEVQLAGQTLYAREMTAAERDDFEAAQVEAAREGEALHNFRARFLVRVLVDENGNRVFGDLDADQLGLMGARAIRKAFDIASKLNALSAEDEKDITKKS